MENNLKFIDDALRKVIHVMNLGQRKDLVNQQTSSKYALLLGFCFMLGIDTLKNEEEAWLQSRTFFG